MSTFQLWQVEWYHWYPLHEGGWSVCCEIATANKQSGGRCFCFYLSHFEDCSGLVVATEKPADSFRLMCVNGQRTMRNVGAVGKNPCPSDHGFFFRGWLSKRSLHPSLPQNCHWMAWLFSQQAHTGTWSRLIKKIVSSVRMAGSSHAVAANRGQNHIPQNIWSFEQMQLPFKGWLHASESSSCWKQAVHWQWSHHPIEGKSGCDSTRSCWVMLATLSSKRVLPSLAEMCKCMPRTCIQFQCISGVFALLMTLAKNRSCTGLARAAII